MDGSKKKRHHRIRAGAVINILVIVISVCLVAYFFFSEEGLMDLLRSSRSIGIFWLLLAVLAQLFNVFMDTLVTFNFIHSRFSYFTLWDALKVCLVGQFYSAITPSSTGGQPMQVYLMSKMNIGAGFGTSCMMQKFIVYQLTSTAFSLIAIVVRFDYFLKTMTTPVLWAFVLIGFLSQMVATFGLIVVSFNEKLSAQLVRFIAWLMKKLRFIKDPEHKADSLRKQIEMFHESNKELFKVPRLMVSSYLLVFLQILAILSVPYFIYRSFQGPGVDGASYIDILCSQAYVNLASSLIPLPGASGAAELGFSAFFGMFFVGGTLKSAILVWRIITYYGMILVSSPFSYFTKDKRKHDIDRLAQEMSAPDNGCKDGPEESGEEKSIEKDS